MKKLTFLIYLPMVIAFTIFQVQQVIAQDYQITFAGTGYATTVDSVEVENLTTGKTITMKGSDILHLTPVVGIPQLENNPSSEMRIYPNPASGNAILALYPPAAGDAIITVYDMTGKTVAKMHTYLGNGRQEFRLSGLKNGMDLISIMGNGYKFSGKILSNGQNNKILEIEKINSSYETINLKSSKSESKEIGSTVDMPYSSNDILKYTASSGKYSLIRTDIPDRDKAISFNFIASADGDSNTYETVKIGSQIWFAENLNTTKYSDGTSIPFVPGYEEWSALSTAGYCWYNDSTYASNNNYGAIYNKYAVLTGKLCPEGWHIPKESEWLELINFLGGMDVAGGKIKQAGVSQWYDPNTGATNESGFSGVPSGNRRFYGSWDFGGNGAFWWSISDEESSSACAWSVEYNTSGIYKYTYDDKASFTARCVIGDMDPALSVATIFESKVSDSTATFKGIIMDDGGTAVTEKGICWSTLANPTISDSKIVEEGRPGTFTCLLNGLELFTRYFVRAYAINSQGIAYGNEIDFISGIGMNYLGGKVAYIFNPGGYTIRGLIAATEDQSEAITWSNGSDTAKIGTSMEIGSGNLNTTSIVARLGDGNYAAKLCYDLVLDGYSDWYLPSLMELNLLYLNREAIGGFKRDYYWSSSEDNGEIIRVQTFENGAQHAAYKNSFCHVRAVRSF